MEFCLEAHMPVILLQVNDFQRFMLTCLGPYLLWFVMGTPFSLLLLPLLQCIDLGEHLCYVAVQSFVCRCRDIHLNTVASNTCPTYAKSTEMTIQPLLKSPIKPLLNGSNCTKGACMHLCGMIPDCTFTTMNLISACITIKISNIDNALVWVLLHYKILKSLLEYLLPYSVSILYPDQNWYCLSECCNCNFIFC